MTVSCCGQARTHWPQAMQSLARSPLWTALAYACLPSSICPQISCLLRAAKISGMGMCLGQPAVQ